MGDIARLKDEASAYDIYVELCEWYGSTCIPERMKGEKLLLCVDYQSPRVILKIDNGDGSLSKIAIPNHRLIQFVPPQLGIYSPSARDLTPTEEDVLCRSERVTGGEESKKLYFKLMGYPYLRSKNNYSLKHYDSTLHKIIDHSIRGKRLLLFNLRWGQLKPHNEKINLFRHEETLMKYRDAQVEATKCGIGYCTGSQIMRMTGIGNRTLMRWRENGWIKFVQGKNGLYYYDLESVFNFLNAQEEINDDKNNDGDLFLVNARNRI